MDGTFAVGWTTTNDNHARLQSVKRESGTVYALLSDAYFLTSQEEKELCLSRMQDRRNQGEGRRGDRPSRFELTLFQSGRW